MAGNEQKRPFGQSINNWGRGVADSAIEILGKSLPATVARVMGAIVQVNYEVNAKQTVPNVNMPVLGSRWYRAPYQVGEKGGTITFDAYMGGMSGLGGGTADLTQRGNLTTSAWAPVGSTEWPGVDPNQNTITGGPTGVLIRDAESATATVTLSHDMISLMVGGFGITITPAGTMIDGVLFLPHMHTRTQPGGGVSGPVET